MRVAMILSAGYGTRLRPLTDVCPKPLVPVGDRPLLAHTVERLAQRGVTRVVLNTHHLASEFRNVVETLPIDVDVVHEPEIRGTAGGISGARPWLGDLDEPLLIVNGDILCDPPVEALLRVGDPGLTMVVAPRQRGEGTLGLDADGDVVRMRGEVFGPEALGADYVGVAAVGPACLGELPERGCLVGDWALPHLRHGGRIPTVEHMSEWVDIGSISSYLDANFSWLTGAVTGGVEVDSWASPSARWGSNVRLDRSVIGEGAQIEGAGEVMRSVIWPGARVTAPVRDSVVLSDGRVVPRQ